MLLDADNISKTYRGSVREVRALENVSVAVDAGEFVAVCGPSGCGKTTLLLVAGGLLAPDGGTVQIGGKDPYAIPANERALFRGANVGFVFQQFHLIPYLSVIENVLAPAIAVGGEDRRERAEHLISHFGMTDRMHHLPGQLSTGERQRAALARALLNKPKLLLADEPTGNLDQENAEAVLKYLAEFAADGGGVLMVSHDDAAVQFAQRSVRIHAGQLVTA